MVRSGALILVTGAGGFVGRQVCRLFTERGLNVLAVDRSFSVPMPCPIAQGDLRDADFISGLFQAHTIYNTPADNWSCGALINAILALNRPIDPPTQSQPGRTGSHRRQPVCQVP